jgi:hypothetical protein
VSCYAFFEWWLLLSQHPDGLRNFTSLFALSYNLGTLDGDLGCFPFDENGASPPSSNCRTVISGIRSLIGPVSLRTIRTFQCSTPRGNIRRKPESSFGENQLLQRSISFSLQPTSHPKILHNLRVRPSLLISEKFSLLMGSSRCFGSDMYDKRAIHTRFRYGSGGKPLSQAVHINSLAHSSIGTLSRCKHLFNSL